MEMLTQAVILFAAITGAMSDLVIIPREGWNARPPIAVENMTNPVPYVVIHHSYIPGECLTPSDCVEAMQFMQDLHQNDNGWNDIGYHFAVGGDGLAYEGRGWSHVGAHAPGYNNISIGIVVIGDWTQKLPPANQLATVHALISYGVWTGMIREDYLLVGHRQVREGTECPGDRFFSEVSNWPHFVTDPLKKYVIKDGKAVSVEEKKKNFFVRHQI